MPKLPEIQVTTADLPKIQRLLRVLPAEIRLKVLKQLVLIGARDFHHEVVRRVPVGKTGRLANSISVRRGGVAESGLYEEVARVIASRGKSKGGFYSHLVEFGHHIVVRRFGRTVYRGYQPAKPFMGPAFEAKKDAVSQHLLNEARRKVIFEVNKLRKLRGLDRLPRGL